MYSNVKMSLIVKLFTLTFALSACNSNDTVKLNPVIVWDTPDDLKAGAPLSEAHLNATADVPGSFTYTPPLGTILDEGDNQVLTAEFIPDETATYNNITSTVTINVIYNGNSDAIFNPDITYGTLSDIDGNSYRTVNIAGQEWMAENLRTTKFRNGESIALITSDSEWVTTQSAAYASYESQEDIDFLATNGLLYNYYAVSDNQNIAPEGWHVATQADWERLIDNLGGAGVAGGKIKESGNGHWNTPNTGGNNSSGFTALPAGRREYSDGNFINLGFNGFWWTSTPYNPDYSWYYQLNYDTENIIAANFQKGYGFAIRCVKD